ncbi:hypothetical protein [Flammeovirga sp. OC4]|uniref:hypothetical protein n=1 Tax=Flammeovirga sp. OC4 TaxID=1382345 RepID=UPI0005C611E0|nr:hypothetical protein [Flammeovirga sp. OC4]
MLRTNFLILFSALFIFSCSTDEVSTNDQKLKAYYENGELMRDYSYNDEGLIARANFYRESSINSYILYTYSNDSIYQRTYNADDMLTLTRIYSKISENKYKIERNYTDPSSEDDEVFIYTEHPTFGYNKQERYYEDGTLKYLFECEFTDGNGSSIWYNYNFKEGETIDDDPLILTSILDDQKSLIASTYSHQPEARKKMGNVLREERKFKKDDHLFSLTTYHYNYKNGYPISAENTITYYNKNHHTGAIEETVYTKNIQYEYYDDATF